MRHSTEQGIIIGSLMNESRISRVAISSSDHGAACQTAFTKEKEAGRPAPQHPEAKDGRAARGRGRWSG